MANFAKWIGGGIGYYVYGPAGGLLGFLFGSFFDEALSRPLTRSYNNESLSPFGMNLIVIVASVMKTDGKVVKDELDFVKQFFVRQFGEQVAKEAVGKLKDVLQQNINLREACSEVRMTLDYSSRVQLLHVLFNLAGADKKIETRETDMIEMIAGYLGIALQDFQTVRNLYIQETLSSYKILEIEPSISNDEVKKAYRKLAMKYHPDKVSHMGEEKRKTADDKFKRLNEAYERIKKERNMV